MILFNFFLQTLLLTFTSLFLRTDNSIKNHWNSSMRRKIEKYLAKKQGCDESNIRLTEDGRFDFMGDLEGVLRAVRGKDGSATKSRGKSDRRSNKKSGKKRKSDEKMPHMGMHNYMYYGMHPGYPYPPHMPPYDMAAHGKDGQQGNHLHMMHSSHYQYPTDMAKSRAPDGKQPTVALKSVPGAAPPAELPPIHAAQLPPVDKGMPVFSPWKSAVKKDSVMSPLMNMSITPKNEGLKVSGTFTMSNAKKSMFDSPEVPMSQGSTFSMETETPMVGGMTPLSGFKTAFGTPYGQDMLSGFENDDSFGLNKALFVDDDKAKTPSRKILLSINKPKSVLKETKFFIGASDDVYENNVIDMKYNNRLAISPLSASVHKKTAGLSANALNDTAETADMTMDLSMSVSKDMAPPSTTKKSIHFADEHGSLLDSATKVHQYMPSISDAITPNGKPRSELGVPSPFDTSLTPINNYDKSFWGLSPQNTLTPVPMSMSKLNLTSPKKTKSPGIAIESPVAKRLRTTKSEVA
jgi:hypothetical protein